MIAMAEKTALGLAITLTIVLAGILVLPTFSFQVSLVTSPNRKTFFIPAGEPFNITCKGLGDNPDKFSSLQWLNAKGEAISEGIPGTQEKEKNSLTLIFTDPKEDDSGDYKCMAVYEQKQTLQTSVSITFYGKKPVFENSFENLTASENSYLEISCIAEGESPINYQWYNQNEDKITENSNSSIYVSGIVNKSAIIIPATTKDHTGMYTCLATNSHGSTSKIFQLMVLSDEGDNTGNETVSFRDVTATSVKFDFDVAGPVEYIEVSFREIRGDETILRFQSGNDYEIKDLIPAGVYHFKFRTNLVDQWSKTYRVVLLPDKPEVIFRRVDSGTIIIDWVFKFEDRLRDSIDKFELTYFSVQMVSGTSWKPSDCRITIIVPQCTTPSYTISGLSTGGYYYEIQLRAHTAAGYGEPFTQKIFFK